MIHVIIPVHNRLMLTVRCIKSLTKQENFDDLRVIVVDDGSIDGTSKYINENFPKFKILKGDGNLFWGGAVNKGIKYALRTASAQDWILLVNNDVMLLPSTIKNLIKFSESKNRKVLAGSLTLDFKNKKTVIKSGTIIKNWFFNVTHHPHLGKNFKKISTKEPIKVDLLTARCLLHPAEIFKKIGNYNAKTFPHYGGDDDFSLRASKINFEKYICPKSIVYLHTDKFNFTTKKNIKYFYNFFFSKKSSSNLKDKYNFTAKHAPMYSKLSFFFISLVKSILMYIKN